MEGKLAQLFARERDSFQYQVAGGERHDSNLVGRLRKMEIDHRVPGEVITDRAQKLRELPAVNVR